MTASLLLRNVRPYAGKAVDLLIENGKIRQVGANLSAPAGVAIEDGKSEIVIPGLVEAHTHLDKSLLGLPWYTNEVGPKLLDKIAVSYTHLTLPTNREV